MPVNLPTAQDVRKARVQASTAAATAFEQARMPLYAALGAGDLATETVVSYARKARGDTETAQARVAELQASLAHLPAQLRTRMHGLNTELTELRGKLEGTELRELVEGYRRALMELYGRLAVRGERVYGHLIAQPQVQRAVGRVGHAADTAEVRVEKFVEEARVLADEVLGRVAARTRSSGERVARTTEDTATEVADATRDVTSTAADSVAPVEPAPSDYPPGPTIDESPTTPKE